MIDSLNIGQTIFTRLDDITELGHRIYPLIAENNTVFPFVIYTRTSLSDILCKDGLYQDAIIMSIEVVTDNYSQGIDIAQQIRERLTFRTPTIQSHMSAAHEEYANDAYIQTMEYTINMNN